MNDIGLPLTFSVQAPALPTPTRPRWQPLRLGLVELFRYDSEEFWFRDGHLLLRGNNGTGKSKVLSLTLPFLLDAQVKPSRIEPDADAGKRMAWNLLLDGAYDRRIGYAWIEFGRLAEDGTPRYLSLGAGLSSAAGRPQTEAWFFVIDEDGGKTRINRDLWLTNRQRVVLTRERLRDMLDGRGQVFETAAAYRRAVDERLFRLGPKRYDALIDTLIQLRRPQLSRKPDETALSNALTEALPPLAPDLLGDVAEALGQLAEDRRQLDEYQALGRAIDRFNQRYLTYAGTQTRRKARVLRQAQTEFDNASRARSEALAQQEEVQTRETEAKSAVVTAELALAHEEARREALQSNPTMQDANRLERAEKDAQARRQAEEIATSAAETKAYRLERTIEETRQLVERLAEAEDRWKAGRREGANQATRAGLADAHAANPLCRLDVTALAELTPRAVEMAAADLRNSVTGRRDQIAVLRRRLEEVRGREVDLLRQRQALDERQEALAMADRRREQADLSVDSEARALTTLWEQHFANLTFLRINPEDQDTVLDTLADWTRTLQGENPARHRLTIAQREASQQLTERGVQLSNRRKALEAEQHRLDEERKALEAGSETPPPAPHTRDPAFRSSRPGSPFWQLVDFKDEVLPADQAGLEAALEAAGLLDAWVSPDGHLQVGRAGHDSQLLERPTVASSLAGLLRPAATPELAVPPALIERILASIACADDDPADCEAWVSPSGRFRLGALAGAWAKPVAAYVGQAARAASRRRRLDEIAELLRTLADELVAIEAEHEQLAHDRSLADAEESTAPPDDLLRTAHAAVSVAAAALEAARGQLDDTDRLCREAELALRAAREALDHDAIDLRLPVVADDLVRVEHALDAYRDLQGDLAQAAREVRTAVTDLDRQRKREADTREDLLSEEARLATARLEAQEAATQLEVLLQTVGAEVAKLMERLADARRAVAERGAALKESQEVLRQAGEARAIAGERAVAAEQTWRQRGEARGEAVGKFQRFAATGLLSIAVPDVEQPSFDGDWTIDPALGLARRAEQALNHLKDDDEAWTRIQKQVAEDHTELQRTLGALGHQAPGETTDWGLLVRVVYQNRPERPDRLARLLADEIAERSALLTAKEREILENHLQAEVASEIQRLLQAAENQRELINRELYRRPTSTGVRYRLLWQQLTEEEGAPPGLDAARKRLLATSSDLWSAEDRRIVGAMLQGQIEAERERDEATVGTAGGSGLAEQLARALDYRHWHRFRVERWQDGHWRKLSGPASSGERALGLTVPLFAAVASFYSQADYALAPRLMLLDEAFAGIDDAARAHCMGLIREFDLDFVITSEREWACYAELPGVAICQLQRREGIDAIYVSRWSWDGRARARDADPIHRFAPE